MPYFSAAATAASRRGIPVIVLVFLRRDCASRRNIRIHVDSRSARVHRGVQYLVADSSFIALWPHESSVELRWDMATYRRSVHDCESPDSCNLETSLIWSV